MMSHMKPQESPFSVLKLIIGASWVLPWGLLEVFFCDIIDCPVSLNLLYVKIIENLFTYKWCLPCYMQVMPRQQ